MKKILTDEKIFLAICKDENLNVSDYRKKKDEIIYTIFWFFYHIENIKNSFYNMFEPFCIKVLDYFIIIIKKCE